MPSRLIPLLACACAACATTPSDDYPSLAVRDAERMTGTLQPAEPYVPEPPSPATIETVGELYLKAMAAHESFLARYRAAQPVVSAARGAPVGSDRWAAANVAIADVAAERSKTMIVVADLDRLYISAATDGLALDELAAAQERVSEAVADETAKIDEMLRVLGG